MELLLTVTATDGRLTGMARRPGNDAVLDTIVAFSGSLELLACLEQLVRGEAADRPHTESLTTKGH